MTIGAEALPMVSNYALRKPPGLFETRARHLSVEGSADWLAGRVFN